MKINKICAWILAGTLTCSAPVAVYAEGETDFINVAVDILKDSGLDSLLSDPDKVVDIIMYVKNEIGNQEVSDEQIREVIQIGADQLQISLDDSDMDTLVKLAKQFKDMELDEDQLRDQIQKVYDKLDELGISGDDVKGILGKILNFVKNILD